MKIFVCALFFFLRKVKFSFSEGAEGSVESTSCIHLPFTSAHAIVIE